MNAIAELLSEEVRRYQHLYNPSMAGYKDAQMASNSWREISSNVVLAVDLCLKMWRKLRDKYVREKKAILLPFFIAFLVGRDCLLQVTPLPQLTTSSGMARRDPNDPNDPYHQTASTRPQENI
ncbi:hypothetical protein EYF80_022672 [Liparis tanakae]|uniref:MADF domain-containing protein n=1 Tax=Liparis tanakae TaxID=230148 RepID=A0A4Z2HQT5_9TELE|nr:hypothetical protein EYF80_022672 [Liparis tanakae]